MSNEREFIKLVIYKMPTSPQVKYALEMDRTCGVELISELLRSPNSLTLTQLVLIIPILSQAPPYCKYRVTAC